eukprot:Protomagalhaensia_wolfi_Nauph_80__892@NODE_1514_length_1492_cov_1006_576738_g1174_i0_p2_GENE_NODE_1514_length_1492_cov_1006_576738_g1174_i0NODE_1514_length_1492_cov_1006_576738_g1174_i0_p2_ORF_typecomplete_len124_score11_38Histone/PF00125_24/0_0091Chromosome_seg/PF13889_6/0_012_NODE_1514_length_1492_cov_1006_576738_g1174_i0136507
MSKPSKNGPTSKSRSHGGSNGGHRDRRLVISRRMIESKLNRMRSNTEEPSYSPALITYLTLVIEGFLFYLVEAVVRCAVETKGEAVMCRHVQLATMVDPALRSLVYGHEEGSGSEESEGGQDN